MRSTLRLTRARKWKLSWPTGCHRMEPYRSYYPNVGLLLPETERISERILSLPTGTTIHPEDIHKIGNIIGLVMKNATDIRRMIET